MNKLKIAYRAAFQRFCQLMKWRDLCQLKKKWCSRVTKQCSDSFSSTKSMITYLMREKQSMASRNGVLKIKSKFQTVTKKFSGICTAESLRTKQRMTRSLPDRTIVIRPGLLSSVIRWSIFWSLEPFIFTEEINTFDHC